MWNEGTQQHLMGLYLSSNNTIGRPATAEVYLAKILLGSGTIVIARWGTAGKDTVTYVWGEPMKVGETIMFYQILDFAVVSLQPIYTVKHCRSEVKSFLKPVKMH